MGKKGKKKKKGSQCCKAKLIKYVEGLVIL